MRIFYVHVAISEREGGTVIGTGPKNIIEYFYFSRKTQNACPDWCTIFKTPDLARQSRKLYGMRVNLTVPLTLARNNLLRFSNEILTNVAQLFNAMNLLVTCVI